LLSNNYYIKVFYIFPLTQGRTLIKINFLLSILFSFSALADYQNPSLKEFLKEFNKDPKKVMNQTPYKSKRIEPQTILQLESKIAVRKKLLSFNKEDISEKNRLSILFRDDKNILINAFEIDEKPLKKVKLIESIWSGYYWSTINGLLGNRYADKGFDWKSDWEERLEYVTEKPMTQYLEKNKKRDILSPAEKYDLLIGNYDGALTSVMWEIGKKEMEEFKEIRHWSGLCHGLAMAALKLPHPKYSIKVWSADKRYLIKFYPEDIKALGIYHWSHDDIPLRLLGGRCDINSPETDSMGRIIDPNCRDTNSGSFHLALINRVGVQKKSLIMDSSRDDEVWNFPIVGYSFNFFKRHDS
jgi:Transglutaminase elicitor